jgi:hypothetical protein
MSDLATALRDKISALADEKEELEDALNRIVIKIETYEELLAEETGESTPASTPTAKGKGRGRPKGSKNKRIGKKGPKDATAPKDELWEQAAGSLPDGSKGSTAEDQARAVARFAPTPRPAANYGVKAGTMEEVMGTKEDKAKKSHTNVTVEDD